MPKPLATERLQTSSNSSGNKPGPFKLEFADEYSMWSFMKRGHVKLEQKKGIRLRWTTVRQYETSSTNMNKAMCENSTARYRIRNLRIQKNMWSNGSSCRLISPPGRRLALCSKKILPQNWIFKS